MSFFICIDLRIRFFLDLVYVVEIQFVIEYKKLLYIFQDTLYYPSIYSLYSNTRSSRISFKIRFIAHRSTVCYSDHVSVQSLARIKDVIDSLCCGHIKNNEMGCTFIIVLYHEQTHLSAFVTHGFCKHCRKGRIEQNISLSQFCLIPLNNELFIYEDIPHMLNKCFLNRLLQTSIVLERVNRIR